MGPSGQRLEPGDLFGPQIDQGLIVRLHVPLADGSREVTLDKISLADTRIHFDFKEPGGGARFGLGTVHGNIGLAHDFDLALAILRNESDADGLTPI